MAFHNQRPRWIENERKSRRRALWEVENYPVIMHAAISRHVSSPGSSWSVNGEKRLRRESIKLFEKSLTSRVELRDRVNRAERESIFTWNHLGSSGRNMNVKLMLVVFLDLFRFTLSRKNSKRPKKIVIKSTASVTIVAIFFLSRSLCENPIWTSRGRSIRKNGNSIMLELTRGFWGN